jgi:hypothetical protein
VTPDAEKRALKAANNARAYKRRKERELGLNAPESSGGNKAQAPKSRLNQPESERADDFVIVGNVVPFQWTCPGFVDTKISLS